MQDERGWLGRAQWMPVVLPGSPPRTRLMVTLIFAVSAIVLFGGWFVAHVTGSVGWGFVAVVGAFLVELCILGAVGGAINERSLAARSPRSEESTDR